MIVLKRLLTFMAVVLAMAHSSARATILDVTTPTSSANGLAAIGDGFIVSGTFIGSAGTGNIDPFLRLGTNADTEQGFNTSAGFPLDDKTPINFTHAVTLNQVPVVDIGGTNYREFLLDANQTNNGNISLNQLQIFQSNADLGKAPTTFNVQAVDATHNALITFTTTLPTTANEVFRMSDPLLAGTNNQVQINSGNGSGTLDMVLYVKDSLFTNDPTSFVTLYSQFGAPPGTFTADDGFEEWKLNLPAGVPPTIVPEPSSMAIAGLGALGFLGYGLRRRLKK